MNDFNQLLVLAVFFNDFRNGILDYSEVDIVLFRCLLLFFFWLQVSLQELNISHLKHRVSVNHKIWVT